MKLKFNVIFTLQLLALFASFQIINAGTRSSEDIEKNITTENKLVEDLQKQIDQEKQNLTPQIDALTKLEDEFESGVFKIKKMLKENAENALNPSEITQFVTKFGLNLPANLQSPKGLTNRQFTEQFLEFLTKKAGAWAEWKGQMPARKERLKTRLKQLSEDVIRAEERIRKFKLEKEESIVPTTKEKAKILSTRDLIIKLRAARSALPRLEKQFKDEQNKYSRLSKKTKETYREEALVEQLKNINELKEKIIFSRSIDDLIADNPAVLDEPEYSGLLMALQIDEEMSETAKLAAAQNILTQRLEKSPSELIKLKIIQEPEDLDILLPRLRSQLKTLLDQIKSKNEEIESLETQLGVPKGSSALGEVNEFLMTAGSVTQEGVAQAERALIKRKEVAAREYWKSKGKEEGVPKPERTEGKSERAELDEAFWARKREEMSRRSSSSSSTDLPVTSPKLLRSSATTPPASLSSTAATGAGKAAGAAIASSLLQLGVDVSPITAPAKNASSTSTSTSSGTGAGVKAAAATTTPSTGSAIAVSTQTQEQKQEAAKAAASSSSSTQPSNSPSSSSSSSTSSSSKGRTIYAAKRK